jgi:hypothetical protein
MKGGKPIGFVYSSDLIDPTPSSVAATERSRMYHRIHEQAFRAQPTEITSWVITGQSHTLAEVLGKVVVVANLDKQPEWPITDL